MGCFFMVVLTKKKIINSAGIIAFFIILYTAIGINISKLSVNQLKTVETAALPVNNKVIVIDAGHGIPDERS